MISNEEPNDDFKHLESTLTITLVIITVLAVAFFAFGYLLIS
jgi:hypothetical protein